MFVKDLETLKYSELQKLAKNAGIKANQKVDKLIKALKSHYLELENEDPDSTPRDNEKDLTTSRNKQPALDTVTVESEVKVVEGASVDQLSKDEVVQNNKATRKRRRTFELDTPTLSPNCTPVAEEKRTTRQKISEPQLNVAKQDEPSSKRIRRNTYDKESPVQSAKENKETAVRCTRSSTSPGTREIINSLDANLSSAERKATLMSAIDKKVQKKKDTASPSQPSQIPRFVAFLANKNKVENSKPVTPGNKNWTKIHDKEFSKFDSLDVYLEKKQQRMETLTGSGRKPLRSKTLAKKGPKIVKPVTRPLPDASQAKPFVPTVTSTKNMSFNFAKTPSAVTFKGALNSTVNQSTHKTPRIQGPVMSARKSVSALPTATTPFQFTGKSTMNTTTTISQKPTFDLKASLAKPLSWKPHTGKLQSMDTNKPVARVKPSVRQAPKLAQTTNQKPTTKKKF
ncbi:nucleolar and spindle-associated protein 1-like isoform X2 [Physella acuta]|uniref:nucleolar and spindle-associated protein 1-like isoform X2 n=1 Tax=Physella acuta TaxID=109671 RepID=UPI0027DB29C8|nr:nucleolar and spindle-associated protein 1-like isoform X2 [Physella acuta]